MALQGNILKDDNEYKIDFNNVYYKIDDCQIDVLEREIRIGLRGYPSQYSRLNEGIGVYKKIFDITFDDIKPASFSKDDVLKACYIYLKSLDEFKETTDI